MDKIELMVESEKEKELYEKSKELHEQNNQKYEELQAKEKEILERLAREKELDGK